MTDANESIGVYAARESRFFGAGGNHGPSSALRDPDMTAAGVSGHNAITSITSTSGSLSCKIAPLRSFYGYI